MHDIPFPLEDFLARFKEFDNADHKRSDVQNYGERAMMHITPPAEGMPFIGKYRMYGVFLMTAHLIALDDENGNDGNGLAGTPIKATVGSVTVETTKQNSFTNDDWNYWLNQTKYGRELLALLETQAPAIFLNTERDSVRDLI